GASARCWIGTARSSRGRNPNPYDPLVLTRDDETTDSYGIPRRSLPALARNGRTASSRTLRSGRSARLSSGSTWGCLRPHVPRARPDAEGEARVRRRRLRQAIARRRL